MRKRRIDPPRLALSVEEAAASVGMNGDAFREHVASELRWVRKGRMKRVAVRELEDWLARNGERLPTEVRG